MLQPKSSVPYLNNCTMNAVLVRCCYCANISNNVIKIIHIKLGIKPPTNTAYYLLR